MICISFFLTDISIRSINTLSNIVYALVCFLQKKAQKPVPSNSIINNTFTEIRSVIIFFSWHVIVGSIKLIIISIHFIRLRELFFVFTVQISTNFLVSCHISYYVVLVDRDILYINSSFVFFVPFHWCSMQFYQFAYILSLFVHISFSWIVHSSLEGYIFESSQNIFLKSVLVEALVWFVILKCFPIIFVDTISFDTEGSLIE